MPLQTLLYRSVPTFAAEGEEADRHLAAILDVSRARNAAAGLSGALFYAPRAFIQVLEGPLASVEATFERICRDQRHRRLDLLEFAAREHRSFVAWSMARVRTTAELVGSIAELDRAQSARYDAAVVAAIVRAMGEALP